MSWEDVIIEIDAKGQLWMMRGKVKTQMLCPYTGGNKSCGDWCPLFNEPDQTVSGSYLELCTKAYRVRVGNMADLRSKT